MVNPELVEEIERSMYVDDLISGGETTKQALEIKMTATTIFGEATFKPHKWHFNHRELELETATSEKSELCQTATGNQKGRIKTAGASLGHRKKRNSSQLPDFNR